MGLRATTTLTSGGGSAEITISQRMTSETVPEAVVFEITNISGFDTAAPTGGDIYDERFHKLYYFWDYGETYSFSAPTRVSSGKKNANVGYGPWGRHVYRTAGNYAPSCLIVEPSSGKFCTAYLNAASTDTGTPGTSSASLTTAAQNTTFATSDTVFMSPSGSFSNAPSGATQVTSSDIDAVIGSNIAGQEATPKRLMLNRGESYTFSGYSLGSSADIPTLYIVAGGDAGAKPSVTSTGGFTWDDSQTAGPGSNKDFVIDGIDWNDDFDPTDGTGSGAEFFVVAFARTTNLPATVMFHDCEFSGFNTVALLNPSTTAPGHFAVVDCNITNWSEAGLYMGGNNYTSFLGNSIKSPFGALADEGGNMGAAFRGNKSDYVIVANDIYSKQSNSTFSGYGSEIAVQPCLRPNAEGEADAKVYIGSNVLEGGDKVINIDRSGGTIDGVSNHIIEKNFILPMAQSYMGIQTDQGGMTIRNNIMVFPNVPKNSNWNDFGQFVRLNAPSTPTDNLNAPIDIYSNTVVVLRDNAPAFNLTGNVGTAFNNVTTANNITHNPNGSTPVTTYAPLADDTNQFAPIDGGFVSSTTSRFWDEGIADSVIDFDAQSGAFTSGLTLTGGTSGATATIYNIVDNGTTGTLYLGPVSGGPFVDNETITDSSTGSATANGASRSSGFTDTFEPETGSSAIGAYSSGLVAYDDYTGAVRSTILSGLTRSSESIGAVEPNLES